jgi:hypothetical protein
MIEKRMGNQGKGDKVEVELTIVSRSFSMVSKLYGIWRKQIEQLGLSSAPVGSAIWQG